MPGVGPRGVTTSMQPRISEPHKLHKLHRAATPCLHPRYDGAKAVLSYARRRAGCRGRVGRPCGGRGAQRPNGPTGDNGRPCLPTGWACPA